MTRDFVPIRSVKQYFEQYAVNGIGKGVKPEMVREQLIDAFQKEIFGQLMARFKDPALLAADISTVSPETRQAVDNILRNSVRKWKRLCIVFTHVGLRNVIFPSDLMVTLEDIVKAQTDTHLLEETEDEKKEEEMV